MARLPPLTPLSYCTKAEQIEALQAERERKYAKAREPSDAKIFYDAVSDIQRTKNHPFFDPTRFAYRVTPSEFRAIGRHLEYHHGGTCVDIIILGCEVLPVMAEIAPVIKDYGSSG